MKKTGLESDEVRDREHHDPNDIGKNERKGEGRSW
jgi:hypothetical protein